MADTAISALPPVTAPQPTDVLPIVSNGITSKVAVSDLVPVVPVPTFAADTDIDFSTAGANKVLAAVPSNGKPYSFVTPASGAPVAPMPTLKESHVAAGGAGPATVTFNAPLSEGEVVLLYCGFFGTTLTEPTGYATLGAQFGAYERGIVYYLVAVGGEATVEIDNTGGGNYGIVALIFDGAAAPLLENFGSNGTNVSPPIVANAANGIALAGFTAYSGQFSAATAGHILITASQAYDGGNGAVDVQTAPTISGNSYSVTQDADSINASMTLILYGKAQAVSALGGSTDIDFSTAGPGKVLAVVASNGKPYSFVTPASGGSSGASSGSSSGGLASVQLAELSLTHLWECNDAIGSTTLADSRGATPLTVGATAVLGAPPLMKTGGASAYLPGLAATDMLSSAAGVMPTAAPFTLEFVAAIFCKGSTSLIANVGDPSSFFDLYNNPTLLTSWNNGNDGSTGVAFNIVPGIIHLCGDGAGNLSIYLNGALIGTRTGAPTATDGSLWFGTYRYASDFFTTMQIQNIATYGAQFSQAQAFAHATAFGVVSSSVPSGPDAPPVSPSIYDDEFDGTALDPKWTIANSTPGDTDRTVSFHGIGQVLFESPDSTNDRFFGVTQIAPPGPFTMTAKVSAGRLAQYSGALFLLLGTSAAIVMGWINQNNTTNPQTGGATLDTALQFTENQPGLGPAVSIHQRDIYLRLQYDGTTFILSWSINGVFTPLNVCVTQAASVVGTLGTIGIGMHPYGGPAQIFCDWFRVTTP